MRSNSYEGSACWAMVKSWLDVQVDLELACLQPGGMDQFKTYEDAIDRSHGQGDSQPRHLSALLQKLHSSDSVHEAITQECKEQHRQIEMNLMMGDIPHLLDVMWSWISPSEDGENVFRPHGDPQMIRFGAHLVLVLRYLLVEQMQGAFKEKIMTVEYAIFLFSKHHEELVGIYASQLAHHRCIDLFVHMMELRLNSSLEYDSKGSFEEIVERVLSRSREIKAGKYDKSSDIAEQHRLQSLQKAMVVQWLCFTPPSTINDAQASSAKFLLRAPLHRVFQIIEEKCGGLLEVDRRTIALDNLFEARLKVRGFDSGFLPAFMEVKVEGRSSMVRLKSLSKTVRRQVETWPKVFRPAPSGDPIANDMEADGSGRTRGSLVRGSRRGEGVEGSGDRFGDVVEVGGRPRDRGIKIILNGPQKEHDGPSKILGSSDFLHVGQEFNYQKPISVFPRDGPFSKQYKEYNGGPNRSDELNSNELGPVGYMNGAHILEEGIRAESQPLGAEVQPDLIEDEGQPLGAREIQQRLSSGTKGGVDGEGDRVDDSVEGEQRLAAEVDEWVDERIKEENDAELLSRKVDEGCFKPIDVLQALNIYGSGSEESLEYDSGSGCEEEDQEESDLELINLFTEKDNVEEDKTENDIIKEDEIEVSETMDHVNDSVRHDYIDLSSQRGHIVIPDSFSLRDGIGVSQCLGLKCSVRGKDDRGVTPDISGAMRDVPITNPVFYNANINAGQVNDAQEGASVMHLHIRGCVFSSLRDSEVETER
ncbi:unnamed protein product [Camellia sinensis]